MPPAREIVIEFDRDMVPLGRMARAEAEVPAAITPQAACHWRWIGSKTLSCRLDEKDQLQFATRYTVTVRAGVKALDGSLLAADYSGGFLTQRPRVSWAAARTWRNPTHPQLRVEMNQPVTAASLMQALSFRSGDKSWPVKSFRVKRYKGRRWIIEPQQDLPPAADVQLWISPGLVSELGPEAGIDDRAAAEFRTFGDFEFLGVRCRDRESESIDFPAGQQEAEQLAKKCDPLGAVYLRFSAPLNTDARKGFRLFPGLGEKEQEIWQNAYLDTNLGTLPSPAGPPDHGASVPWTLRADQRYRAVVDPALVLDAFGRKLAGATEAAFVTDHRLPAVVFEHGVSVLEKGVDSHLPIYMTNIERLVLNYETLTAGGAEPETSKALRPYDVKDLSYKYPIKVHELLGGRSGVMQGRIQTTPAVRRETPWFFSQVTPFAVHFKLGHFNSLVWVTRFADGRPVPGATVSVLLGTMAELGGEVDYLAEVQTDKDGAAVLPGTHKLDPKLTYSREWQREKRRLMVRVVKGDDMALLPIGWDFRVDGGDVYPSQRERYGHISAWGTTAQGIYKPGERIQYKFFVRNQSNRSFEPPLREGYTVQLIDPLGKVAGETKDVKLSAFGSFAGEFATAENAAVGWYEIQLTAGFTKRKWQPVRVLVSDFTPAPFHVSVDLQDKVYRIGEAMRVQTQAALHAGGPYAKAPARITATVTGRTIEPVDLQFKQFIFSGPTDWETKELRQEEGELDAEGRWDRQFEVVDPGVSYGRVEVESAVRDDRGKYIAGTARAKFAGRDRYVGVHQGDWVLTAGKQHAAEAIVIDDEGRTAPGTPIVIKVQYEKMVAARVKSAGNAYLPQYSRKWVTTKKCEGVSAAEALRCEFTPKRAGTYRVKALIQDSKGRADQSSVSRWVIGSDYVLWSSDTTTNVKIVPDKKEYRVGDKAKFLIQNPYPSARALVSVERYGIQKHWSTVLANSSEMLEIEITPDHLPGFYLSVVLLSPRAKDKPLDENDVDLGKPAYAIGYVQVEVQDPYKQLKVAVTPRQAVYKPRDKATVDLHVETAQGAPVPNEAAVIALDESVFDLLSAGLQYFDPYKGFYTLQGLDVVNFNLLLRLIGRQKFEKKGGNAGGGGGLELDTRTLFKYVAYWNPALNPDAKGDATVSFEVPDNLTAWRVLVFSVTKEDRMGLGYGVFKVNRPTEIRPALPNQVREGDSFTARATVMNRTDLPRTLSVEIAAVGPLVGETTARTEVQAAPFERKVVELPLATTGPGEVRLRISGGDSSDRDAMEATVPVLPIRTFEVGAMYGSLEAGKPAAVEQAIPVEFPSDIYSDRGGLAVIAAPTLLSSLEGAFSYMRAYPYHCWEQKISKAAMAAHYKQLKRWLPASFSWPEAEKLPAQTLAQAANFQAPNGGMCFWIPNDSYASPFLSAYTALAFAWLADAGYDIPETVEKKLDAYLLDLLRRDSAPEHYSQEMTLVTRAVALAGLAMRQKVERGDVERLLPKAKELDLFGLAHLIEALAEFPDTDAEQAELRTILLAHADETAGGLSFVESEWAGADRVLYSAMRTNCAVLGALVAQHESAPGAIKGAQDAPIKLARMLGRQRGTKDHWLNTQENIFCTQALVDYAKTFERVRPNILFTAALDGEKLGSQRFSSERGQPVQFERAIHPNDPGRKAELKLGAEGQGRIYYNARLQYAPKGPLPEENAGIEVHREYSIERGGRFELLKEGDELKLGDLLRVDLFVIAAAPRSFVVVNDPLPGGLEAVNRDLATASGVDAGKAYAQFDEHSFKNSRKEWIEFGWSLFAFYHRELRHDSARFYSEFIDPGNYHLVYTAQVITPGKFASPPTHAEEMYSPDVFGRSARRELVVR